MSESRLRDQICELGRSLFERGLTAGSSGNLSARVDDGVLLTPTNACLGRLDPARISKIDDQGRLVSGDKPSKEGFLHLSMYAQRPKSRAVAHLHSTHSVAVSVLADLDAEDPIPPLTAYYVMKVGKLALLPYFPPGDVTLADAVRGVAAKSHAVLLANHGPIVAGNDLDSAVYAIEELEETAKLYLLLRKEKLRLLTAEQITDLQRRFPGG
ncbi:MAG: aldolase [Betaproteobacteria bacterium]|nr:aldolase [Betaproteobacteria bacterium]